MRKRVYIAGPISQGDLAHNVNQATDAFVELVREGFAPFCPQWSVYSKPCEQDYDFDSYGEPVHVSNRCVCFGTVTGNAFMQHEHWLEVDLPWVVAADAVLRLPGQSKGADAEVSCAQDHNIPVFTSIEELKLWSTTHQT